MPMGVENIFVILSVSVTGSATKALTMLTFSIAMEQAAATMLTELREKDDLSKEKVSIPSICLRQAVFATY